MTERLTPSEIRESGKWKPPKKELGGVDLVEYFSGLFLNEFIFELFYQDLAPANKNTDSLLYKEYRERISPFLRKIIEELKAKNLYFHELEGKRFGSVFMDYKIMEDEALRKLGRVEGPTDPLELDPDRVKGYCLMKTKFNPNMTLEEALIVARDFVSTWEWGD